MVVIHSRQEKRPFQFLVDPDSMLNKMFPPLWERPLRSLVVAKLDPMLKKMLFVRPNQDGELEENSREPMSPTYLNNMNQKEMSLLLKDI